MKLKRFFASDIRQAIKLVREELGPDAVILSNRSVDGGVEIVSAVDYDEALMRGESEASSTTHQGATPMKANIFASQYKPQEQAKVSEQLKVRLKALEQAQAKRNNDAERASKAEPEKPKTPEASRLDVRGETRTANRTRQPHPASKVEWSQDPALVDMRSELKSLRSLLENQLSGLAWGDLQRRNPMRAELVKRLTKLGIGVDLCKEVCELVSDGGDFDTIWQQALLILEDKVLTHDDDILAEGGIVALVGPTGVGKTTTIAKLAARYALRHGSRHVALITLDNYRIGAYEQLRAYGRILDIPVRVADKVSELRGIVEGFYDRRLILIDTAGMSQRDSRLQQQLAVLRSSNIPVKSHLVLSTTTRLSALEEIVRVYKGVELNSCILTKLDETTSLGSAMSAVIRHGLPVSYVSDGQRVPEDIHTARASMLVQRSVDILSENERLLDDEQGAYSIGRITADANV